MFWKYNTLSTSQVESFLEKENVSLKELLELEDIIQECKNQNKKLVEYLVSGDVLSNLIDLIIHEPPEDLEPSQRFKCAHVAAELLSCEVPQVNEKISCEEVLLDKLYSFLETSEAPLNPLLASFFSKAFGVLITRKSEQNWYSYQFTCLQVFEFLKKKEFVSHILKHIGTSAISDLVLRLITCVEGTNTKQGLLDWLNEKQLIESIIGLLNDSHDRDTHDNASRLLIEILRVSRDGQYMPANERCNDPLLATLESPATVELLLNTMFGSHSNASENGGPDKHSPSESVLVNGISVLLALLENRKAVNLMDTGGNLGESAGASSSSSASSNLYGSAANFGGAGESGSNDPALSPEELAQQQVILDATIASILPRLVDFTALLTDPPNKVPIKTTAGVLDPPLGQARLHIAKLVSALLATNNLSANLKLIELKTLDILLDLFFQYSLNNFLHAQVECCIKYAFCCVNAPPAPAVASKATSEPTWNDNNNSADEDKTTEKGEEKSESDEPKEGAEDEVPSGEADGGGGGGEEVKEEETPAAVEEVPMEQESTNELAKSSADEPKEDEDLDSLLSGDMKINPLLVHLFTDCHLVDRVLGAWDANDNQEAEPGFKRKGYMGHLTRIANIMHLSVENKAQETFSSLMSKLDETTRQKWSSFVSGKLAEVNDRNTIVPLNSYSSNAMSSSEDDDSDFRDIHFPQESALQQIYSDYQMQQMSDNIHDPYGFTEDDFADNDDSSAKRVLRFGLEDSSSPSNKQAQQDLFESFCKTRFTCFPGEFDGDEKAKEDEDDEDEDDPWENKTCEITFGSSAAVGKGSPTVKGASESCANLSPIKSSPGQSPIVDASSPSSSDHVACSSSDEEDEKETAKENSMEVEDGAAGADDFWAEDVPAGITPVDMDTGNPWDSAAPTTATLPEFKPVEEKEQVVAEQLEETAAWAAFNNDSEMADTADSAEPAPSTPAAAEGASPEEPSDTTTEPLDAEVPEAAVEATEESVA